jgi:hypothetical protein
VNYYFFTLMVLRCAYAFAVGGEPERLSAGIYVMSVYLTRVAVSAPPNRFHSLEIGIVAVDVVCFAAFVVVATRAERFWLIWASSFVGLGVLGHLARWIGGTHLSPWVYAFSIAIWSYPIMALMVIGTFCHQRRLARFGCDTSWTPSAHLARVEGPACT